MHSLKMTDERVSPRMLGREQQRENARLTGNFGGNEARFRYPRAMVLDLDEGNL